MRITEYLWVFDCWPCKKKKKQQVDVILTSNTSPWRRLGKPISPEFNSHWPTVKDLALLINMYIRKAANWGWADIWWSSIASGMAIINFYHYRPQKGRVCPHSCHKARVVGMWLHVLEKPNWKVCAAQCANVTSPRTRSVRWTQDSYLTQWCVFSVGCCRCVSFYRAVAATHRICTAVTRAFAW